MLHKIVEFLLLLMYQWQGRANRNACNHRVLILSVIHDYYSSQDCLGIVHAWRYSLKAYVSSADQVKDGNLKEFMIQVFSLVLWQTI